MISSWSKNWIFEPKFEFHAKNLERKLEFSWLNFLSKYAKNCTNFAYWNNTDIELKEFGNTEFKSMLNYTHTPFWVAFSVPIVLQLQTFL